jgi:DNA polymerase-3 subunit delta'
VEQGVPAAAAPALLRAAGGRPDDALRLHQAGRDPAGWARLPKALARGEGSAIADWTPAEAVDALQKVCHDLLARASGAEPRFFEPADLPATASFNALSDWSRELARAARTVEHPYNTGLMLEALVSRARSALNSRASSP